MSELSLMDYVDLDGTEVGELCEALLMVKLRDDYALTPGLEKAIQDELDAQFNNFKENATVVEREETYTQKFKTLQW